MVAAEKAGRWRRPPWAPASMDESLVKEFEEALAKEWAEFLELPPSSPLVPRLPPEFAPEIRSTLGGFPEPPRETRARARELVARAREAIARARATVAKSREAMATADALREKVQQSPVHRHPGA